MTVASALKGTAYPYRRNSLNMFRLILAAMVLFAHAFYIAGAGEGPMLHGENLGGWAVAGFFVLSGFLITRSRLRTAAGEYLLHRVARIFPAFITVLIVTAFVFAPIAAVVETGTLQGFLSTAVSPLEYIWTNLALEINSYSIGTTLQSTPYPGAWNGSLWTLYYEFLCYVLIWVLGGIGLYRRSPVFAGVAWLLSVLLWIGIGLAERLGLDNSFFLFAKLLPFFLGGALIYFLIERIGPDPLLGSGALVVGAVLIFAIPRWGGQLAAPLLAYGLLWLSSILPQPRWIAQNDVSYGFYIYAWPVQQLTVLFGGAAFGLPLYICITVVVTLLLAWLSWVCIERPAMLWARPKGDRLRPPATLPGDIRQS
ncbi:MAG: acyltransferase family protein [Microbacterium sp.]|uniref:acyltransferase family protein n=1 Tax=Microbacterium sp. TaxID=51671 RepID=UPI003A864498